MPQENAPFIVCPNLMLIKDQKILLLRRTQATSLFGGYWHVPTGKIEGEESPKQALIRETLEEIGLRVDPVLGTVVAVRTQSFQNPEMIWRDISLFFVLRPGTVPVPLCVGLGKASQLAKREQVSESKRALALRNKLLALLQERFPDLIVNGDLEKRLPGNLNVSFQGVSSKDFVSSPSPQRRRNDRQSFFCLRV